QSASVVLALAESNGTLVNGSQLVLGAKESRHVDVNSLPVPFATLSAVTHVIVRALGSVLLNGRSVVAEGKVTQFRTPSGNIVQDTAVVAAMTAESLTTTAVLPLFVQGFGYFTQLQVVNNSDNAETVTLTARGTDGTVLQTGQNPVTISI